MYYITMYSTKKNQEEECFPFRKECTAIAKRIRTIQERNQRIARSASSFGDPENIEIEPSYGMGLGHVLSGITAHLWSSIISAPMAWYLVVNGSRFRFSHEFVTILLSQVEGWLLHKDIQLRYRRNMKTNSGWLDSTLLNYLYRPSAEIYPEFENMSLWEFVSEYGLVLRSQIKRNGSSADDSDDDENTKSRKTVYYDFDENHPGYHFAKLQKLKKKKYLYYTIRKGYLTSRSARYTTKLFHRKRNSKEINMLRLCFYCFVHTDTVMTWETFEIDGNCFVQR